jgi:2-amino-4-hydroxy-6-hydroxymethyldihydropteridine diphosphokinase
MIKLSSLAHRLNRKAGVELTVKHQVYLSLGSNIDREDNIRQGLIRLRELFGTVQSSPVYESEPVGFSGGCFYNLVVKIETEDSLLSLSDRLKRIEDELGRSRKGERFSSRTMDIDILLFDALSGKHSGIELPRPEVYYNAFVLQPLADLAPTLTDPVSQLNFAGIWAEKSAQILSKQRLWPVTFDWPEGIQPVAINYSRLR